MTGGPPCPQDVTSGQDCGQTPLAADQQDYCPGTAWFHRVLCPQVTTETEKNGGGPALLSPCCLQPQVPSNKVPTGPGHPRAAVRHWCMLSRHSLLAGGRGSAHKGAAVRATA